MDNTPDVNEARREFERLNRQARVASADVRPHLAARAARAEQRWADAAAQQADE